MKRLAVTDDVYDQIALLARAWSTTPDDVIRRLLSDFRRTEDDDPSPKSEQIAVHAVYAGTRTEGLYDPVTQSLAITTGLLAGRTYTRPSGAAVALVTALSPAVNPNRNGWSFWVISKTGQRLQSIRNR
jgi:negative regulator of replication initiation